VHELEARVTPDDGSSDLRGSLVGEFEAGEVRRLRLVAGRTFGTPVSLRLD